MSNFNFFATKNVRIFLAGLAVVLFATIFLMLEIDFPYIGKIWWAGFVISLVSMILVIRDVTHISKPRNKQ